MFGDSDARRDDLGSGEPLQVTVEVDPMDSATDTSTDESGDLDGALDVTDDEAQVEDDATPDVPTPPVTGDQAVDEAMMRLAESQAGSFAERIEAGEHAHRSLQGRLGGLGGA